MRKTWCLPEAQERAEISKRMLLKWLNTLNTEALGLSLSLFNFYFFFSKGNFSVASAFRIVNLVQSFFIFQCSIEMYSILGSRDASWNQTVCKTHHVI